MAKKEVTREDVAANPEWAAEKINFLRERVFSLESALGAANPGDHSDDPIRVSVDLPAGKAAARGLGV